ncbi:MAG: alpha/beta hydrolase [Cyanothece sp. SIO1E1]|nr:alpha/beta hydrolase [Cyanothece sp. SIO1E1]
MTKFTQRLHGLGRQGWLSALVVGAIAPLFIATAGQAAEHLSFFLGPLQRSVRVDSLEKFAVDGTIEEDLRFYLSPVNQERQAEFRQVLQQRFEIDPIQLSRVFNTPIGEEILALIGTAINLPSGGNGKFGLRAALVLAALEPDGLTILNLLQQFPTDIRLSAGRVLILALALEQVIDTTNELIGEVSQFSAMGASTEPQVDFSALPDIRQPGQFGVEQRTLNLTDVSRNRQFRVLIYQPQRWRAGKTPVVVMSHGLASNPEDRGKRAAHLTSYGYVVAVPQHPGSDTIQIQNLLAGFTREVFALNEFIDRPADISYVIDELERRNQSEFGDRLDLENVGLFGHSFGGYTVLALAGAEIDFENLEADCNRTTYLNISLLLQCRALELPRQNYSFRDQRVKAVIGVNPVNNSIFGPRGLRQVQIPTALGAGSLDPATPAIYEQLQSFPWLQTSEKYLAVIEGQAHVDFSQLDAGITSMLDAFENLTLPSPDLIDSYGNAITLSFFEIHIANNPDYRPYLHATYAAHISQDPFNFYLLSAEEEDELTQALKEAGLLTNIN